MKGTTAMKRLLKSTIPPNSFTVAETDTDTKTDENKYRFSTRDLVDVLNQIDELDHNVAIGNHDGVLQLAVGNSVYAIDPVTENRHPRRRLRKLET